MPELEEGDAFMATKENISKQKRRIEYPPRHTSGVETKLWTTVSLLQSDMIGIGAHLALASEACLSYNDTLVFSIRLMA